ncbi:hypothetical protein F2P81_013634 [Scophthalmus maximus]|uniref:PiggyBac transposable element-derived protein domain-containing protein n=1 Tax=Scophthalmus maximus TaxID=52904 RepID=A0A6A4SMZ5_SCOMX|nr:hypothetical protein F2P81_013634 [Scophthalmus maximus]
MNPQHGAHRRGISECWSCSVHQSFQSHCVCIAQRTHQSSKLAKYGIKMWVVCESRSSYAWKMQVYTGEARLTVNPSKCQFAKTGTEYVCYIIRNRVIKDSDSQTPSHSVLCQPQTNTQLKSFLRMSAAVQLWGIPGTGFFGSDYCGSHITKAGFRPAQRKIRSGIVTGLNWNLW